MREIRLALLEADVNFQVVRDFVQRVREQSLGQEVMRSLTPGQQVVKIVRDELTALMGEAHRPLTMAPRSPTVFLLVGLHGSGKTTTAAKLAKKVQEMGHRPLLVAADVYRPAAMEQLRVLGESIRAPVFVQEGASDAVKICRQSFDYMRTTNSDAIILDTAGRLQIDEELMQELRQIKQVGPLENLLSMIPGIKAAKLPPVDESGLKKVEAIISSMTPDERHNHTIINGSRRKRIAHGSGTSVEDVNRLLKQFAQTQKLMKTLVGKKKGKGKWGQLPFPRPF